MPAYAAMLRAINVGGTGKLPMVELRALAESCGFQDVASYIQSGNLVFRTRLSAARAKQALEQAVERRMGKQHGVLLRSRDELEAVVAGNPFPKAEPKRLLIVFLEEAPPPQSLQGVLVPGREELRLVGRELYIHFPDGMGASKLKVPFQQVATGRNFNTVSKLLSMLQALG